MTSLASCWQRILPAHSDSGRTAWSWCAFGAVSLLGTAALDAFTPLKLAAGAGYLLAVLSAGMVQSVRAPWVVAALATGLSGLGLYRISPSAEVWSEAISRGIFVGACWLAAWIVAQWQAASKPGPICPLRACSRC